MTINPRKGKTLLEQCVLAISNLGGQYGIVFDLMEDVEIERDNYRRGTPGYEYWDKVHGRLIGIKSTYDEKTLAPFEDDLGEPPEPLKARPAKDLKTAPAAPSHAKPRPGKRKLKKN